MALDALQQQQLADWLAARQIRPACPVCGAPNPWTGAEIVAALPVRPSGLHIGEPVTPLVQLTCGTCAHVLFFAAEPLGVYTARECRKELRW